MFQESSVTPIVVPHIAWSNFLKDVLDSTGRSPTRSIDESEQKLNVFTQFLVALQELRENKTANPVDVLRDANSLLQHLAYSFLVVGSAIMIFNVLELTSLSGVSAKTEKGRVVLLSGNLGEWKLATIDLCNSSRPDLRWLGKTLLDYFFELGFSRIFANYDRKIRPDGTLLLECSG